MILPVTRRPLAAEVRIPTQATVRGIYGGKSKPRHKFSPSTSVF